MNIEQIINSAFDKAGVLPTDKHRKFIVKELIKTLSVHYKKDFNEQIQDILSSGFSLHNDSNQWIIQSTGYGDKDFTAMEWNGDNQREYSTIQSAIKYVSNI